MHKRLISLISVFLLCWVGTSFSSTIDIRHPVPQERQESHRSYFIQLLGLAFSKMGVESVFRAVPSSLSQERQLLSLNGNQFDVMWTMTSKKREQIARPIRIPIMKGLLGYRVLVIHQSNYNAFQGIDAIHALKKLSAIQGHDWPDTKILSSSGLNVTTSSWFPDMYRQLAKKKVDYFPRGILEAWGELDKFSYDDLEVFPHLALYYPSALYYFVSNTNGELAALIESGLNKAIADGSFDRLFLDFPDHAKALDQFNLNQARVLKLGNPLLPQKTPLNKPSYWFKVNN